YGLTVKPIALVVVYRNDGGIDGNFVKVRTAQAQQLGVEIRVDAPGQQGVVRKVDTADEVGHAKGRLFRLGEEIVRVAVQRHATDDAQRHEFLGNDLGGVQHIEAEGFGLLLGE